ncbi:MAG: S9 family peptidase [Bacteroidota bacterium]
MKILKQTLYLFLFMIVSQLGAQNRVTPELLWKLGRVSDLQLSPDETKLLYGITNYDIAANKGNRDLYVMPVNGGEPQKVTEFKGSEANGIWRPDGKKIGFLTAESGDMQVWEMNPDGSEKIQVSKFAGGINGFMYAQDMKHVVFVADVKMDNTVNEVYKDLPKADARIIDDLLYRHWDSWHDFAYSHVFVGTYENGAITNIIDIMNGEKFDSPLTPDGGMEQIAISPDGKTIVYTCRKLHGKDEALSTNSDLFAYNIETKTTQNLTEGMLGYDQDPVFSPDGSKLVFNSMKTAAYESDKKRIMLYDFKTKTMTDLSATFDQSSTNFKWAADNTTIYFISGINATYQLYSVNIKTNKIEQLTTGRHDYTELCAGKTALYGCKMSMSMPIEIFKVAKDKKGYVETQLSFTNKNILANTKMGQVEERWVKTTDNKKMLVWVIYPPDFDKNKKYPALLYCQGGPQSAVSQFFSYRWNFQIMAANDYIIVAPNRRGLPTFGQEWNDEIAGDYAGQNMKDYLSAIDSIAKEPFVNAAKLGCVGASYGAFSVYWLAGNHQGRFKAFLAHCGMFNLESWYGTTEEMWFANHDLGGPYWDKNRPKIYDLSPHKFVGNWDTPIMVVHGANDFRIPFTEGMQAFDAAQLRGIPSRFLYFPEESHFVLKPQNSILWQREFFRWFDSWLK